MLQSKVEVETHIQNNWNTTNIYYDMQEIPVSETEAIQVRFEPVFREQMSYGGTVSRKREVSQMSITFVGANTFDVITLVDEMNLILDCFQGASCTVDVGTNAIGTILDPSNRAMTMFNYRIEEL